MAIKTLGLEMRIVFTFGKKVLTTGQGSFWVFDNVLFLDWIGVTGMSLLWNNLLSSLSVSRGWKKSILTDWFKGQYSKWVQPGSASPLWERKVGPRQASARHVQSFWLAESIVSTFQCMTIYCATFKFPKTIALMMVGRLLLQSWSDAPWFTCLTLPI